MRARPHRLLLLTALVPMFGTTVARAHDTWFEPHPATERGEAVVALGTGNRFPTMEAAVSLDELASAGCGDTAGRNVALRWMADLPTRVMLRSTRPLAPDTALSCVAQLKPLDVRIDDTNTVQRYFDEARPGDAVLARWKQLRAQGLPWLETYTKRARLMMSGNLASGHTGQGLDVRIEAARPVLRVGDTIQVQVLLNGQPLAGQMIELRHTSTADQDGRWQRSDDDGRISLALPQPGRWLLRGINLRPSPTDPQRWSSDFLTVALEVRAPGP